MNSFDIGAEQAMTKIAETRAERKYRRAKAHVAKGHEEERKRLGTKGALIGVGVGGAPFVAKAIYDVLRKKKVKDHILAQALAQGAGAGFGTLAGHRLADSRLRTSQQRQEHGHYAPFSKRASDVREQTAKMNRSQIWGTKRSVVKPVVHKPKIVNTPQPPKPQIEPSTTTPSQPPTAGGQPEKTASRKKRRRSAEGRMGEPRTTWKGQKVREYRQGPENEPVPESWRGRDF
jgi:hypothetical protein